MADTDKRDPEALNPQASENDEPIIDLVEEIGDTGNDPVLSDLEENLLDLERKIGISLGEDPETEGEPSYELPEIADIEGIGIDESPEDTADDGTGTGLEDGTQTTADGDIDWLLKEFDDGLPGEAESNPALGEITEITDFDEQFLEAEEIDDEPLDFLEDTPAEAEEEPVELFDLEEDEADNEIVWLDDLAEEAATDAGEIAEADMAPAAAEEAVTGDQAIEPAEDPPAAAVHRRPPDEPPPLSAAAVAPLFSSVGSSPEDKGLFEERPEPGPITEEQIDAAVARIIEQRFSGRIEAVIVQAIEKAVTREIERLKKLLLDDDPENDGS